MATRTKALPATGSPEPHTTARDTTRPARTRTRTGKDRDCMDRDRVDLDPDHKLDPSLAPAALPLANAPGHPLPPAPTRGSEDFPGIGDGEVVTDRRPASLATGNLTRDSTCHCRPTMRIPRPSPP
jgi:hypothetical protein